MTSKSPCVRDKQVLSWAATCSRGSFEQLAIAHEMPVIRAYQILNRLLNDPKAVRYDPHTMAFWRAIRDGQTRKRDAA